MVCEQKFEGRRIGVSLVEKDAKTRGERGKEEERKREESTPKNRVRFKKNENRRGERGGSSTETNTEEGPRNTISL